MRVTLDEYEPTRGELHRVATHILARRRYQVTGRFGLRVTPGGVSTPLFGPDAEQLRTSGATLVREVGGRVSYLALSGATLAELARFAEVDLGTEFRCGDDTPELGDPDRALTVSAAAAAEMAGWMHRGWMALDRTLASLPADAQPETLQLWPEHFDIGTNVAVPTGDRVNLGCSPGDAYEGEPYLYVGPWGAARPGDAGYWNAPFGAVLAARDLPDGDDALPGAIAFFSEGLGRFSG
ncbi:MAG: hypothetical protein KGQ66_04030 [Acidobacteriota bacterium]|nr:hypothetical protein [Acidobacteriota bacterium]